ncbi:rhodanese-like domain-containing protein [Methylobacter sp. S3L5C]|nr:rhodanese-like domain-containing protein [Methylobacter sp. S3L5C]
MRLLLRFFQSAFVALLIACAVGQAEAASNESLSPRAASSMSAAQKAVIVDVREDSEWNKQHIPGAIHIPLG